jgi:hypothetical protein
MQWRAKYVGRWVLVSPLEINLEISNWKKTHRKFEKPDNSSRFGPTFDLLAFPHRFGGCIQ